MYIGFAAVRSPCSAMPVADRLMKTHVTAPAALAGTGLYGNPERNVNIF